MIKIVFFDIDGTILNLGKTELTEKVKYALNKLRDNNIKIFIATGRPSYTVPDLGVKFDGYLTFNGSYSFEGDNVIYNNPLNKEDVQTLIQNANKMDIPLCIAGKNKMGANYYQKDLSEYFSIASQSLDLLDDFDEFSHGDIYQIMAGVTEDKDKILLENTSHIVSTRWWPRACDFIPNNGGKDKAIQKILDYYGFSIEESMSFGDGGNDKSMIEYAGIGVAMGNAVDEVKLVANYITDSVEDDGVYTALKHFGLI